MRKLYEIRSDIMAAIEYMIYGEESAINPPSILEDLEVEAEEKIKNCFWAVNHLAAEAAEADVIIKNAQDFKAKRLAAIDRIEADIKITMEVMGIDKINTPDCRVTLGAPTAKVDVVDEKLIPVEYMRVIPESKAPDKVGILKLLKTGVKIAGVELGYGEPRLTYPKIKGE